MSNTSVNRAAVAKVERAWAARVAGGSWSQVAKVAGYSDDTAACRAVRRHYGQLPEVEAKELRTLWRDRLEALWRMNLEDMREHRSGAARAAVAIERAAAQLDGLDAPQQFMFRTPDAAEFDRVVRAISMREGGVVEEIDPMSFEEPVDAEVIEDE